MAVSGSIGTQKKKADISTPSVRHEAMRKKWSWDLIDDLKGGTLAMREAGRRRLPQQEAETDKAYNARLERSFLFEGFSNTVDRLSARPFKKDVTWTEDGLDDRLAEVFKDVDKTGVHVTQYAYNLMQTGMYMGLSHILVDFPRLARNVETDEEGKTKPLSIAEERELGVRPIWIEIAPENLFFWRVGEDRNLTEIRFFENEVVDDGGFGDMVAQRIRRYTPTTWEIWEQRQTDEKSNEVHWVMIEDGAHTFGAIPLATFYTDQDGILVAKPPMLKLAWLNLTHWQSYSDQRNLLNVARAGVLFGKGFTQEQIDDGITVGPRSTLWTTNKDASLEWVEHSGKAITAGQADIEDIENKMTVVGTEPLIITPAKETATGRAVDANANESAIQAWIRRLEAALDLAAAFTAKWMQITLPENFGFKIFSDFGVILRSKDDLDWLLKARVTGDIDQQTFLEESKKRGIISEGTEIDDIIKRLEKERKDAMSEGLGMPFEDDLDDDDDNSDEEADLDDEETDVDE